MQLVCPMPSIDYPGTRESEGFLTTWNTRVVGSSTRGLARAFKFKPFFIFLIKSFNKILITYF